jgi:hypothetical protein
MIKSKLKAMHYRISSSVVLVANVLQIGGRFNAANVLLCISLFFTFLRWLSISYTI